ncbi:polysaccharide pyruvyl transferase WcaK-like protein [Kitasatospora gansuensis]|uniref:Polysaccharide pyruvyl transferase WcaK-like protein n=1 Tax=Kitasatospora gansuensis TaxID=258050 RepID=A0A7W7WGQ5_9ACTN|nr:polysaccharide pyruvyl transferase family protein [Kitasatospora gansuensis]MBB4947022.1 polysaccharide pyruvyl transferase WcaK-like protein [Kitasatospora gansuensis]
MKIVVVNAFARGNRGDAALLSVALQQLERAYPGARISIAGFEEPGEWPSFDGVPNIGSIRRYVGDEQARRITRISRKAVAALLGLLAALPGGGPLLKAVAPLLPREMRAELRALAGADLVLSLGGGYLNGKADFASDLSIGFLLLPLWLARRFGVPVVLAPQSCGPFPTRTQRLLMRRVLAFSRRVVAREEISIARLTEAGVPGANLIRGVDSAFAFQGNSVRPWRQELGIAPEAELVLVTARQFLDRAAQAAYEAAMAAAVRHLVDRGCQVVLVPQVTCTFQEDDDRIVNRRIAALLDTPGLHVVDDETIDHHEIFALYGAADFILGTRFHSVIFGLIAGVPCAAVEYDHKTRGIMADLGLGHWVVRMAEARPDTLVPLMDRLLTEGAAYREHLCEVIPAYAARAEEFVGQLLADVPGPVRR